MADRDRLEALERGASATGRSRHVLEKDVWVVWALQQLFEGPHGESLVFKGGTSLSKAYGDLIHRFSEDVDLTYDIRAIAGDLVGDAPDALPASRSQADRWSKTIRDRLAAWVNDELAPDLARRLDSVPAADGIRAEGDRLFIRYRPLDPESQYVVPSVMLEFGARSTGEPCEVIPVSCDLDMHIEGVLFPTARPRVMTAERTFWEKATAMHVVCLRGESGDVNRVARHWHDVVRLDDAGIADRAIADRELAGSVAAHKSMFFRYTDRDGEVIDYAAAVGGQLQLVPEGDGRLALARDYQRMVDDGMLYGDPTQSFNDLAQHCEAIQRKANASRPA